MSQWKYNEEHYWELFDWLPWGQSSQMVLVKVDLALIHSVSGEGSVLLNGSGEVIKLGTPQYMIFDATLAIQCLGKKGLCFKLVEGVQIPHCLGIKIGEDPLTLIVMPYDSYCLLPHSHGRS